MMIPQARFKNTMARGLILKLCLLIKHLMAASMAYPNYRQKYIEQNIDKPGVDPAELRVHLRLPAYKKYWCSIIVSSLVYYLRGIIYPTVVMSSVDSMDLASNVRRVVEEHVASSTKLTITTTATTTTAAAAENSHQNNTSIIYYTFLCLSTNCSRLSLPGDNLDISLGRYLGLVGSPVEPAEMANQRKRHTVDTVGEIISQLGEDFYRLPFFTMCHPTLSYFHDQMQYLQLVGMLTSSVYSVGILLVGALLPVLHLVRPSAAPFLMFILAPRVSRRVMFVRLRDISMEIKSSCYNYRLAMISGGLKGCTYNDDDDDDDDNNNYNNSNLVPSSYRLHARTLNRSRISSYSGLIDRQFDGRKLNQFVRDCFPSIKTDWWRHKLSQSLIISTTLILATYILSYLAHYLLCYYLIYLRRNYLQQLSLHLMSQQNCSLWYTGPQSNRIDDDHDDYDDDHDRIDLAEVIPAGINWLHIIQFLSHIWPISCMGILCSLYYATNSDLFCYLSELRFQMEVSLHYARIIISHRRHLKTSANRGTKSQARFQREATHKPAVAAGAAATAVDGWDPNLVCGGLFRLEPIRRRFRLMADINLLVVTSSLMVNSKGTKTINSRLKSQLAMERFVVETMDFSRDSVLAHGQLEMLEKLYISFRGYAEHMRDCTPFAGHMMLMANLLNYSALSTCVVYVRYVRNFLVEPLLVVIGIWILCSFFLLVPSNLHAKTRKLEQLIWSLLAETCQSDDVRLEHMRLLWLKQLDIITTEGGLALSFLNIRITYVNIIQMLVWTATIFVLAMRL